MSKRKNTAFYACQIDGCNLDISYPESELNLWRGEPICEACYNTLEAEGVELPLDAAGEPLTFLDLPPFVSPETAKIRELERELEGDIACVSAWYRQRIEQLEADLKAANMLVGDYMARHQIAETEREELRARLRGTERDACGDRSGKERRRRTRRKWPQVSRLGGRRVLADRRGDDDRRQCLRDQPRRRNND